MNDLGTKLKIAHITRRILAREVAARADLSPSQYSDFENNWRTPRADQLEKICEAIGIEPGELLPAEAVRR